MNGTFGNFATNSKICWIKARSHQHLHLLIGSKRVSFLKATPLFCTTEGHHNESHTFKSNHVDAVQRT